LKRWYVSFRYSILLFTYGDSTRGGRSHISFLEPLLLVVVVAPPLLTIHDVGRAGVNVAILSSPPSSEDVAGCLSSLKWGRCGVLIHHTCGDKAWLPGSASHSWVPSCCRCRREHVNRMNLDLMQSIWLVYLYCLVAENQPRITEDSTPY
jgi:hypothetical protein